MEGGLQIIELYSYYPHFSSHLMVPPCVILFPVSRIQVDLRVQVARVPLHGVRHVWLVSREGHPMKINREIYIYIYEAGTFVYNVMIRPFVGGGGSGV